MTRHVSPAITIFALAVAACIAPEPANAQALKPTITSLTALDGEYSGGELISPNGRLIAYIVDDHLRVHDIEHHASATLMKGKDMGLLSWSPAGDAIAFVRDRNSDWAGLLWSQPVDPNTGAPRGAAQRVSMTRLEDAAAFSPDGKLIAFAESGAHPSIRIVPATGGKERVVLKAAAHADITGWTSDGKSLLFTIPNPALDHLHPYLLQRVSISGGTPTTLLGVASCSIDSSRFLLDYTCSNVSQDSMLRVSDLSGHSLGTINAGSEYKPVDIIGGSTTLLMRRMLVPLTLETISTTNGANHQRIAAFGAHEFLPLWSPDARRIALISESGAKRRLVVMNADGSDRRELPAPDMLEDRFMWSPDGRYIAYRADDGARLQLVDMSTFTRAAAITPASQHHVGAFQWRSDSRALQFADWPKYADNHASLYESTLDGTVRTLHDLQPWALDVRFWHYLDDSTFTVFARDSMFIVPSAPGAAVRSFAKARKTFPNFSVSPDGRWLASAYATPGKDFAYSAVELISITDGSSRLVSVPFEVSTSNQSRIYFAPDGKHLLVMSAAWQGTPRRLWSVSTAGEPARVIGTLAEASIPIFIDLSHDGRTLLFTRPGTPTTIYGKADFSSLVKH